MTQIGETLLVLIINTLGGGSRRTGIDYPPFSWGNFLKSLGFGLFALLIVTVFLFLGYIGAIAG